MEQVLLTAEEVCSQLRMTSKNRVKILLRWAREGRLKGTKIGTRTLFRQEWIDAFVRKGELR